MAQDGVTEDENRAGRLEPFDELRKVGKATGQPVDLVDHNLVDETGIDVVEQALQARALQGSSRAPRVLVDSWQQHVVSKNTNELKTSATSYLSPSARCAPVNGLAGCYVSSIGKPHEYFDLTTTGSTLGAVQSVNVTKASEF